MADEYLKREDVIKEIDWYANEFSECEYAIMPIMGYVKIMPACDVAPVVRCKDCKHNWTTTTNKGKPDRPRCKYTDYILDLDDFCSRGERKDNE